MTSIQFAELKKLLQPKPIYTRQLTLPAENIQGDLRCQLNDQVKIVAIHVWFIGSGNVALDGGTIAETSISEDKVIQVNAPAGTFFAGNSQIIWSGLVGGVSVSFYE